MRRWTGLALPALVLLAVNAGGSLAQSFDADLPGAEKEQDKQAGKGWFPRLNPFGRGETKKEPTVQEKADSAKKKQDAAISEAERAFLQSTHEYTKYNRRLEVCEKIQEIALQQNDERLYQLAGQLQQRAFDLYQQRTARAVRLADSPSSLAPAQGPQTGNSDDTRGDQ